MKKKIPFILYMAFLHLPYSMWPNIIGKTNNILYNIRKNERCAHS